MGTCLLFLAPLLVTVSLTVNSLVGIEQAPNSLSLAGGSIGILIVAAAPTIPVVLIGLCIAQLCFNDLLAVQVAVLPDQVPVVQRGMVSGVLGVCLPIASVTGTFLVQLFTGTQFAMFLVPCAISGFFILLFAVVLKIGSAEADVPQQIFLGILTQSVVIVIASLIGGRLSDRTGRGKSSSRLRRSCTAWRCS